jgi:hypothetical protein
MAPLVTNAGDAVVAGRMFGATPTQVEPHWIGWGTTNTAEAKTQTALAAAAAEARTVGTSSQVTTTVTNDTHQIVGTITSLSAQTIVEVAVFDALTVGNMYMRGVHGSTVLAIGDSIAYTIKVSFN